MLVLRGIHPTVDEARSALLPVQDKPLPDKPARAAHGAHGFAASMYC